MSDHFVSRVPWGLEPSLKDKAREAGVDFDRLIECFKENKSDSEIAEEMNVSSKTVANLREHFEKLGIQSIVGRD